MVTGGVGRDVGAAIRGSEGRPASKSSYGGAFSLDCVFSSGATLLADSATDSAHSLMVMRNDYVDPSTAGFTNNALVC